MSNSLILIHAIALFLLINQHITIQALRNTSMIDRAIAPINLRILPAPYNSLTILKPPKLTGRLEPEHRIELIQLMQEIKPKRILDISSTSSLATIYLSTIAPLETLVYAINNYQTPETYEQWLANIIHHKLIDRVILLDDHAREELATSTTLLDLIYLHELVSSDQLYAALDFWLTKLSSHGVLCGNTDFLESNDYSRNIFTEYAKNLGYSIQFTGTSFWRLIKD